MTTTYHGKRRRNGSAFVSKSGEDGPLQLLPLGLEHVRHSPDGFEWGYGGSGPAQLAFALCLDVLGDPKEAELIYHDLKRSLIQYLPREGWEMDRENLVEAIDALKEKNAIQD